VSNLGNPAAQLISNLIAGLRDGSLSPSEGGEVLEACADLIEELAEHVDKWWARLVLSAASGAVRQAADEIRDIPSNESNGD